MPVADDAIGCGLDSTPSIAIDGSGRAQLAWSRTAVPDVPVDGNHPGLWHAAERADGSWSTDLAVALDDGVASPDLATGPDDAAHIAYARYDAGNEGVYEATNASGSWVTTKLASLAPDERVGWTRIAVSDDDQVDVAWGSADGVMVATRTGGTWGAPASASPDPAGDVDLVRDGTTLHLAIGLVDGGGDPSGIAYAVSDDGGPWSFEGLDDGADVMPRLAVDAAGPRARQLPARLARARGPVRDERDRHLGHRGRRRTGSTGARPAFAVDAAGVRHVAVGRTGEEPGVWYGTDTGGHWTMARLTTQAPDGPVGLVVAPDGTASIAYAERLAADGTPLADPAVRVTTGKPGHWTTTRIADDTGDASPSIARDAAGRLHVAFGRNAGGLDALAYATNASGAWVVTPATPGAAGQADRHPSIAVDAAGKAHVAFERSTDDPLPYGTVSVDYATNASGTWVTSPVASGLEYRLDPSIALDPSGQPRIAYWLDSDGGAHGTSGGVRVATFNGLTWSTATTSTSSLDTPPVDRHRRRRPQPRPVLAPGAVLDLPGPALPVGAGPPLLVGHAGLRRRSPGHGQHR